MGYPDRETYESLYARYVQGRDPVELLDLANVTMEGRRGMDLCCGGGALAFLIAEMGAIEVIAVDEQSRMFNYDRCQEVNEGSGNGSRRVWLEVGLVAEVLVRLLGIGAKGEFGLVTCRQGVNYWINEWSVHDLASVMAPGGVFVFNTFNLPPPYMPTTKIYQWPEGDPAAPWFSETSYLDDDMVWHVQCRSGMAPHVTRFKWIPPRVLRRMLELWFETTEVKKGRTTLWRCVRRSDVEESLKVAEEVEVESGMVGVVRNR